MKISFWDTGDYPILVNPTDQELIDFGKNELWDTLRICIEKDNIGIASGHGNTHTSCTDGMRKLLNCKYLLPETYIVFRTFGRYKVNLQDMGGSDSAPFEDLKEYISDVFFSILQDLINYRESH